MTAKLTGIVKTFDSKRGFGFLTPLIGLGPDAPSIYFHVSAIRNGVQAIPRGAEVRFKLVRGGERGPQAADIEMIELSPTKLYPKTDG